MIDVVLNLLCMCYGVRLVRRRPVYFRTDGAINALSCAE